MALTTNGILLAQQVDALAAAGLSRVTVSLDTLRRDRFAQMTRQDLHGTVLDAVTLACQRFTGTKLDAVVMRGVNDDELVDLIEYAGRVGAEVRFICTIRSTVTMLQQNSPVARTLRMLSFSPSLANITIGGSDATALKKL